MENIITDRIDPETGEIIGKRVQHPVGGRILTKQSDAKASDINAIVHRHVAHGIPLPGPDTRPGAFGDFTNAMDYHSSLNRLIAIDQAFHNLPADIRRACNNDPANYVDLVLNPDRLEEAVELGLRSQPEPEPPPAPAPPTGAPATPTTAPGLTPQTP